MCNLSVQMNDDIILSLASQIPQPDLIKTIRYSLIREIIENGIDTVFLQNFSTQVALSSDRFSSETDR